MRKYLTKERIYLIVGFVLMVSFLAGCGGKMNTVPVNKFTDETNLFGWLLIYPIAWIMHTIGSWFGGSYAWGIIFTTIIIRTIAWPIYAKSNDMSMKMNLAQDDIQHINDKYRGRTDPEAKNRSSQEMMAVYKKHGINPLGCLFPFLQMPIFMAMYSVVQRVRVPNGLLTLSNSKFLGIFDLSSKATAFNDDLASAIFGIVLSIIVGVTMFLIQHLAQKKPSYVKKHPTGPKSQQADMMAKQMKFMNIFMIGMMVLVATTDNAMALYWVVGNIYSLGQNILNRKLSEIKYEKMKHSKI